MVIKLQNVHQDKIYKLPIAKRVYERIVRNELKGKKSNEKRLSSCKTKRGYENPKNVEKLVQITPDPSKT